MIAMNEINPHGRFNQTNCPVPQHTPQLWRSKTQPNCQQHLHTSTHRFTWDYMCMKSRDWGTAAVSFQTTPPVCFKQQKCASSLLTARPTPAAISDNCYSQQSTACSKKRGEGIWGSRVTVSLFRGTSVISISTSDDRTRLWTAFEGHVSAEPLMCAWLYSVHFNPFVNCLANYIAYSLLHNASFMNANKSLKPDLQEQFGKRGKF